MSCQRTNAHRAFCPWPPIPRLYQGQPQSELRDARLLVAAGIVRVQEILRELESEIDRLDALIGVDSGDIPTIRHSPLREKWQTAGRLGASVRRGAVAHVARLVEVLLQIVKDPRTELKREISRQRAWIQNLSWRDVLVLETASEGVQYAVGL